MTAPERVFGKPAELLLPGMFRSRRGIVMVRYWGGTRVHLARESWRLDDRFARRHVSAVLCGYEPVGRRPWATVIDRPAVPAARLCVTCRHVYEAGP